MTIIKKEIDMAYTKNGAIVDSYDVIVKETKKKIAVTSKKMFNSIESGNKIDVYYSEKIDFGIISSRKKPLLITCIFYYNGIPSFIIWSLGFLLIISVFILGFHFLKKEWRYLIFDLNEDVFGLKFISNYKLSEVLAIGKKLIPDLLIISAFYFICFISIKAIVHVEKSNDLLCGMVIYGLLLIIAFFPSISFKIRRFFKESTFLKNLISVIKICLGIYSLIKSILFIQKNNFEFNNLQDFIINFLKYLVNY